MKEDTPSRTSLMIAIAVLILGGDAYGRVRLPPGCLEAQISLLEAAGFPLGRFPWIICNPLFGKITRLFLRILDLNSLESIGYRKCWLEEQVRNKITKHGATQVLVLAAGYDTLAVRLSREYENVTFWEVDHPATSRVKEQALKTMGQARNLHTLSIDLTTDKLSDRLQQRIYYNPTMPTVVVMEGLLMYLTAAEVRMLFTDVAQSVGPGSIVAFDFLDWRYEDNCLDIGLWSKFLLKYYRDLGEPLQWGCDPAKLPEFFAGTRWTVATEVKAVSHERLVAVQC
jgi:methyltransferase (TIGR00027 family)